MQRKEKVALRAATKTRGVLLIWAESLQSELLQEICIDLLESMTVELLVESHTKHT